MNARDKEYLYNLLPAFYRVRDVKQGGQLRALLAIMENVLQEIDYDIDRLYDNWFIETCDPWVVPYIGDLLGVRGLNDLKSGKFNQRAYIANTVAYRRRKGTATVLEQLAHDVTEWPARAVEFFQKLITTQHMNHVRSFSLATVDVRNGLQTGLINSPFESATHTLDVRHVASGRGKYNIPNIGLFLWRLRNFPIEKATARKIADGLYTFNPLGIDAPLFNNPVTEKEITHLAEEMNVPGKLRRRVLYDELEAGRQAIVDESNDTKSNFYFNEDDPVLKVYKDGTEIESSKIVICNLATWHQPPKKKLYHKSKGRESTEFDIEVAVDPVLGRLALSKGTPLPNQVQVSYSYGFSGEVGGGPYDRSTSLFQGKVDWLLRVNGDGTFEENGVFCSSLEKAILRWNLKNKNFDNIVGMIVIVDNLTYDTQLPEIEITGSNELHIVSAIWPDVVISKHPEEAGTEVANLLIPNERFPHVLSDLKVQGIGSSSRSILVLNGLLIEGKLSVKQGNLKSLRLGHCTLVPSRGGIEAETSDTEYQKNASLNIELDHCICGPVQLANLIPELSISESIITQNNISEAISAPGTETKIDASTIFGASRFYSLHASNSIFTETVQTKRKQTGCVRFSYLPIDSQTPKRFRCQPELALKNVTKQKENIREWLKPLFTSRHYGDPGYAQLDICTAEEILSGAEDGSEMGVFRYLQHLQREANLRASLDEYLRFGLEAGIFYVT